MYENDVGVITSVKCGTQIVPNNLTASQDRLLGCPKP